MRKTSFSKKDDTEELLLKYENLLPERFLKHVSERRKFQTDGMEEYIFKNRNLLPSRFVSHVLQERRYLLGSLAMRRLMEKFFGTV